MLRDTGCTTAVVRESLCQKRAFTGEQQACLLIDGTVIVKPVVTIHVDTPFYRGQVRAIAMERPVYDVVIGNIPGARSPEDPEPDWKPGKCEVIGQVTSGSSERGTLLPPLHKDSSGQEVTRLDRGKLMVPGSRKVQGKNIDWRERSTGLYLEERRDMRTNTSERNRNSKYHEKKTILSVKRAGKQVALPESRTQDAGEDQRSSRSLAEDLGKTQVKHRDYQQRKQKIKVKPGDMTLVLMPSGASNILQWRGPFKVKRQVRGNCFLLDVYGKERIYHVSMLERCLDRTSADSSVMRLGWYSSFSTLGSEKYL